MSFVLSNRSKKNLEGVNPRLVEVVKTALSFTLVDFGITQGLRTLEEQQKLFDEGKTKTLKSKHLSGNAIDVVAYRGSKVSWEIEDFDKIADAMRRAGKLHGVKIRWGAAWSTPDIRSWNGSMKALRLHYIEEREALGKKAFIDGPHFEVS